MASCNGRFVISYNGEVYNAAELRQALEAKGHVFRGTSDTEVIVEGCAAWGVEACIERLIGMFAFGVWDRQNRELWLVRDRIGIKPLYWARFGQSIVFGSELKALRAFMGWTPEIDRDALAGYVCNKYVAAPRTIYRGVNKLRPGHLLKISAEGKLQLNQYWDVVAVVSGTELLECESIEAIVDQLDELLSDAIQRRMIADVPLGSFLSGGIDSSTVTALMQKHSERPVRSFSIGFQEPGYNEAEQAKAVAEYLGTDHTEFYVEPRHALDTMPNMPNLFDEPFADPSQIPTYLLSRMTRRHVTVALSGDGGDELFAGYDRFFLTARLWNRLKTVPRRVQRAVGTLLKSVPIDAWDRMATIAPVSARPVRMGVKLHRFAEFMTDGCYESLYRQIHSDWPRPEELVLNAKEQQVPLTGPPFSGIVPDALTWMQLVDLLNYLPDDILTKVDRASMAVSLEARVPILDHRVVAFAFRLRREFKVQGGLPKWLLRQVLYRYVPKEIVERPKKGFSVPLGSWLRGPLRSWAEDLLDEHRLREQGFFRARPIRNIWHAHCVGRQDWSTVLWNVLMFQGWLDCYSSGGAVSADISEAPHKPIAMQVLP